MDPALVSVVRVVDGQETGLSVQPAEKKNRLQTGQEFHLQSTGPGSLLFIVSAGRPAKPNATSDVISNQPIASFLPTHEADHVINRPGHEVNHVIHRPGHEADRHLQSANHVVLPTHEIGHVTHRPTFVSKYSSGLPQ